ncbi:uncharacterized protein LOC143809628 isoform X2 [Ranitomeya variabilis]|uniref:uncharacterized protein LOC143809628 isoform X2 n=1 Tax=Ranitomeya variabilis TaxID=490064 RepID=UPI004057913C
MRRTMRALTTKILHLLLNCLLKQNESFPASFRDDAITSLPSSSPLSDIPAHGETKSSIYLSIEQQNSENEEKGEKRQEIPATEETKSSIYLSIEQQN